MLFFEGENLDLKVNFPLKGKIAIIKIERTKATTPPSLLGIERKIA